MTTRQLIGGALSLSYPATSVLAYCAGVIDADGTIGIKRSTYNMRKIGEATQPVYSERICVKQVTPEAIDLLKATFGGAHYHEGPSARKGKRLYVWQITDLKATACLRAILPYLRIKKTQAGNCLALRDHKEASKKARVALGRGHVGAARRPDELSQRMEVCYQLAKALNRVGIAAEGGPI